MPHITAQCPTTLPSAAQRCPAPRAPPSAPERHPAPKTDSRFAHGCRIPHVNAAYRIYVSNSAYTRWTSPFDAYNRPTNNDLRNATARLRPNRSQPASGLNALSPTQGPNPSARLGPKHPRPGSTQNRLQLASARDAKIFNPSISERNSVASCPRTLFPAASRGGEKVARPPLPGDTVTIPPLTPLLAGSPIS